jgi:hypothetical protein
MGRLQVSHHSRVLSHKLNDTTGVLNLLFGFRTDVTRLDNDWDVDATLAQQFCVTMVEKINDWSGFGGRRLV